MSLSRLCASAGTAMPASAAETRGVRLLRAATVRTIAPSVVERQLCSRRVRIALVVGAWVGYAVNDTGPVLIAAMLGIWLALLPPTLPDPLPADGTTEQRV